MVKIAMMLLVGMAGMAEAGPYFRVSPLSKIETGAFLKLGSPQGGNVKLGLISPVIWHDSKDGYWLVPGVDYSLLNIGVLTPTNLDSGSLLLGPGLKLDEPIKALVRRAVEFLPGAKNARAYGFLRDVSAPGEENLFLSVGPMWGLSPNGTWDVSKWRGSLQLGATLAARWGQAAVK